MGAISAGLDAVSCRELDVSRLSPSGRQVRPGQELSGPGSPEIAVRVFFSAQRPFPL